MSDITAIIPARGQSKRVPRKNVLPLAGLPVIAHSILHALGSKSVTEVLVSTDDDEIAGVAERFGARVVRRPPELADEHASSEAALLHALDARRAWAPEDPDLVVFLQCTSPLRGRDDIDRAVGLLRDSHADSVFSSTEDYGLLWNEDGRGVITPLNYDFRRRKREQDMGVQLRENGSIYVFPPALLRETGARLGGQIASYKMDLFSSVQLDTLEQYELLQVLATRPEFLPIASWPDRIDLVVFDFDGVMTDNAVFVFGDGVESVRCNRGDGWGIARLLETGTPAMVISTEANSVVATRCAKVRLPCHAAVADKGAYLSAFLEERQIDPSRVAYVGNDINDLECLKMVGFPVVVADAHPSVRAFARLTLTEKGGHGAVREFCDLIVARINSTVGART